ncbi:MAG TPA: lytic transglycosylase domain-containing protein [Caulobacteraceae bacterium]|jgi:soluble lytic murein transglycosylase-like protein
MRAERLALALLCCLTASAANARTTRGPGDAVAAAIAESVQRFGLPEVWIRAVMRRESAGQVRATSPKGAMGLMQLMPDTWATLRTELRLGLDPYDVHDNIVAGAAYLRQLYDQFGPGGFLAAYNAGPGRYLDFVSKGRPLPDETRSYVAAIVRTLGGSAATLQPAEATAVPAATPPSPPSVFVRLGAGSASGPATGLFVQTGDK